MSQDVWQQAAQQTGGGAAPASGESTMTAGLPQQEQESQLFAGGESFPSLFNKTHFLGTKRAGRITKVMDVHSVDFNTKKPKYWQDGAKGPVLEAINATTGQPNRKVMDTHFVLSTDYRITAPECAAIGRDPAYVEKDDGTRVFVAGGYDFKTTQEALRRDAAGIGVSKTSDLIGKGIEVTRAGQHPNPGGNPSWVLEVRFTA